MDTLSKNIYRLYTDKAQAAVTGALKRSREELPHVRGQGQKPGGPHDRRAAAKRSYPTSEVRGGGREEIPSVRGQGPRREELPHVQGQGWRPGGDTRPPRPGAVAGRTNPRPWLHRHRRA